MATPTTENIAFERAHWEDDRGPLVIAVTTVFIGLSLLTVILRLATRKTILKRSWQIDDYAIVVAMMLASGYYAATILSVHYGSGKHAFRVGIDHTVRISSISPALELLYIYCHLATKFSLLFQYRAVFTLNNARFKIAWYIIGAFVIAVTISSTAITLIQCQPFHYLWDGLSGKTEGHCIEVRLLLLALAILTLVADVAILVLPIPTLAGLQMPLKQKLGLCLLFCLGTVACAASVVRSLYASRVQDITDLTYTEVDIVVWSMIEPCVGICCACLATLRPLFRLLREQSKRSKLPSFTLPYISRPNRKESRAITVKSNSEDYDTLCGTRSFGTSATKESRDIDMRPLAKSSVDIENPFDLIR